MALSPQEFEKLKLRLQAQKNQGASAPSMPSTLSSGGGFTSGVKDAVSRRGANFYESNERLSRGEQSAPETALQLLGQGAGLVGDVLFEGAKAVTPEPVKTAGVNVLKTALGQSGLTAIEQGSEAYNSWKQKNPRVAADLEAVVNIGALLPIGKGAQVTKQAVDDVVDLGIKTATKAGEKVSGVVSRNAPSTIDDALELTAPVLNKKDTIAAFEKSGKPGGVETTGPLGKIKYKPSTKDTEIAETALPFISKNKNPAENALSLSNEIENFSENTVTPYLKANPRAVNTQTVNAYLRSIEMPAIFKSEQSLEKAYGLVRDNMIKRVNEAGGTMLDLWNARKNFDDDVIKQFGDLAFADPKANAVRRAVQDMRRGMNDFIATQIGDDTFKQQLRKLNNLFEARSRIAERSAKLLDSNAFKRWAANNPTKARAIKWGVSLGIGGGLAGIAFN